MNHLKMDGEGFFHQSLLVAILVIAACARFYSLDVQSLPAFALGQLAVCNNDSWLGLVNQYVGFTGLPPLYPTLLCTVTDWFGHADFFARAPAALAGIASVFLLYVTGRDFFSPTAGLLAAALMALNYQLMLFDREVSINSLTLLCFLAHGYCFGRLFFSHDVLPRAARPLTLRFAGRHSSLAWRWQPDFPGDSHWVIGFWVSGALAFYTSGMSLLLFLTELLASVFWICRRTDIFPPDQRTKIIRALWLPLGMAMLPWLPILKRYVTSIWHGYILGYQSPAQIWDKTKLLFPLDPLLLLAPLLLLLVWVTWVIVTKIVRKKNLPNEHFILYCLFYWGLAVVSLFCIRNDYSSYAYISWLAVLLLVLPVAHLVERIPRKETRLSVLAALIACSMVVQLQSNSRYDLYNRIKGSDFRLAGKIIRDDENFREAQGNIVLSSPIFNHYLEMYDLLPQYPLLDNAQTLEYLDPVAYSPEFYYLDLLNDGQTETETFKKLASQYNTICLTKLPPRVRLAKFSKDAPADGQVIDCREYLNDRISLK